jgi:hypothetical protein
MEILVRTKFCENIGRKELLNYFRQLAPDVLISSKLRVEKLYLGQLTQSSADKVFLVGFGVNTIPVFHENSSILVTEKLGKIRRYEPSLQITRLEAFSLTRAASFAL